VNARYPWANANSLTFTDAVALLGGLVSSHRLAALVQHQLVGAHKHAVLGLALEILNALHAAVVLAGGRVQFNAYPGAGLELRGAYEADDAACIVRSDQHRLAHHNPIGQD